MFDHNTANYLQIVSLPIELLGFTLALIEIRFRKTAEFIRAKIVGSRSEMEKSFIRGFLDGIETQGGLKAMLKRMRWYEVLFFLGMAIFITTLMFQEPDHLPFFLALMIALIVAAFSIAPLFRVILRSLIRFISTFAEGREIGVLGLILAFLGLSAESYQFGEVVTTMDSLEGGTLPAIIMLVGLFVSMMGALVLFFVLIEYRFDPKGKWFRPSFKKRP